MFRMWRTNCLSKRARKRIAVKLVNSPRRYGPRFESGQMRMPGMEFRSLKTSSTELRTAPQAERDVASILRYTRKMWGTAQEHVYEAVLYTSDAADDLLCVA